MKTINLLVILFFLLQGPRSFAGKCFSEKVGPNSESRGFFIAWLDETIQHIPKIAEAIKITNSRAIVNVVHSSESKKNLDPYFRRLFNLYPGLRKQFNFIEVAGKVGTFLRDPFLIFNNSLNPKIILMPTKDISHDMGFTESTKEFEKKVQEAIVRECQIEESHVFNFSEYYNSDAARGGNYLSFSPELTISLDHKYRNVKVNQLVGDPKEGTRLEIKVNNSIEAYDSINQLIDSWGNKIAKSEGNLSPLLANHIDELFLKIPSFPGAHSCPAAIVIPSAQLAIDLLNTQRNTGSPKSRINCSKFSFYEVDTKEASYNLSNISDELFLEIKGIDRTKFVLRNSKVADEVKDNAATNTCFGASGYSISEILNNIELVQFNLSIEKSLESIKNTLVPQSLPVGCRPKILKLPMLFQSNFEQPDHLLSNPINSLIVSGKSGVVALVPDPLMKIFRDSIRSTMGSLGVKVLFTDTSEVDHYGGNLHCVVNGS